MNHHFKETYRHEHSPTNEAVSAISWSHIQKRKSLQGQIMLPGGFIMKILANLFF
jgi:hypothetical protein